MEFKFYPWEKGEIPYFVNEEGYEWYVEKNLTKYAREDHNGHKGLKNVVCFLLRKDDYVTRIIIDENQNILGESPSLEEISGKIDTLKMIQHYKN